VVGQEIDFLKKASGSGRLAGDGPFTKSCNAQIAYINGANAALLTHSATAALEMAALLWGLEPGDQVIMPSFTFVSTANAVALWGAIPVFVDIDPGTLNIDPSAAAAADLRPKIRAISNWNLLLLNGWRRKSLEARAVQRREDHRRAEEQGGA
jgi:dTDP-4-amino-4,6-dideoxygalactose transaminase